MGIFQALLKIGHDIEEYETRKEDREKAMANAQLDSTKKIIRSANFYRKQNISWLNKLGGDPKIDQELIIKLRTEVLTICEQIDKFTTMILVDKYITDNDLYEFKRSESYLYKISNQLGECATMYVNFNEEGCNLNLQDVLINYKNIGIQDFSDTRLAGFNPF